MSKEEKSKNTDGQSADESTAKAVKPEKNLKKLKYGSMSFVTVVLVIVLVIIVNLMVNAVSERSPIKIDITPDKRYELSDESINALKNLNQDVEITVTFAKDDFKSMGTYYKQMMRYYYNADVDMPFEMIPNILENYEMHANNGKGSVKVKYVDMNKDPELIAKYRKYYSGEISEGSIVVFSEKGDSGRVKVISQDDIVGMIQPDSTSSNTSLSMNFVGESTITSAILSVTDSNPIRTAVAMTMNGESICGNSYEGIASNFTKFLSKNGYDCTDIDIATDELNPDDYDLLVIPMLSYDLNGDIIGKIGDFLYNSGNYDKNMIYVPVPALLSDDMPNFTEFLADWNIKVEDSVVLDDEHWVDVGLSLQKNTYLALNIADKDAVGTLPNETLPIISPLTKEITILTKNNDNVANAVLQSYDSAYTTSLIEKDKTSEKGVKNGVAIAKKETSIGLERHSSSLLVIGSPFMLYNTLLEQTNTYNNANVIIAMVNTMTGKEANAVIPEKALQQAVIAPTAKEVSGIRLVTVYTIPIIVAVVGIGVLIRRRNK